MNLEDLGHELKVLRVKKRFTETKLIFKMIQELANELRTDFQLAMFEGDKERVKEINQFLHEIVSAHPAKIEDKVANYENYFPNYNELSHTAKLLVCSYLYNEKNIFQDTENVEEFIDKYVDWDFYTQTVLVSLFLL